MHKSEAKHQTGTFVPTETPSAELEVTIQIDDLIANWKRIGFLANYFAEYVAYDFPQRERAENLLSTITNISWKLWSIWRLPRRHSGYTVYTWAIH